MSLGHSPVGGLVVGKGKQKLVVQGGGVGPGCCFLVVKSRIPLLFVGHGLCKDLFIGRWLLLVRSRIRRQQERLHQFVRASH